MRYEFAMNQFLERPHRVHAWKWDGSQDLGRTLVEEWGLIMVSHASLNGELTFKCGGDMFTDDEEVALVGDWILTPNEGLSFFCLPDEDFSQLYAEVER
jgi:hypothetical protein